MSLKRYSTPVVPTYPFNTLQIRSDNNDNLNQGPDYKKTTKVTRKERSQKCLSVGSYPTSTHDKENLTTSLYELSNDGWICRKGKDKKKSTPKNVLNLDDEIMKVKQKSSTAEIQLGAIKILF